MSNLEELKQGIKTKIDLVNIKRIAETLRAIEDEIDRVFDELEMQAWKDEVTR